MEYDNGSWPASLDLRGTDSSHLAAIRRWAARLLSDLDEPHRDDVLLVLTEVVQNAYQHAGGARQIQLTRWKVPCEVLIGVDDNSLVPPIMRPRDDTAFGGRGLHLVDTLASSWGFDDLLPSDAKTVWARVRCDLAHQEACG